MASTSSQCCPTEGNSSSARDHAAEPSKHMTYFVAVHLALKPLPNECKAIVAKCLERPKFVKAAVGIFYVALLRNDGETQLLWSLNAPRRNWVIPQPPTGATYVDARTSPDHVLLLRSDGHACMVGPVPGGHITFSPVAQNLKFVGGAAAPGRHGVLIRDDGQAEVYNTLGTRCLRDTPVGTRYVDAGIDKGECILLRSDGKLVFTLDDYKISLPIIPDGVSYTSVVFGIGFSIYLRSDGRILSMGPGGPFKPMEPSEETSCTTVVAGSHHVAVLCADGGVEAFGYYDIRHPSFQWVSWKEPAELPYLPNGLVYVSVAAAGGTTVAIRSDGEVFVDGAVDFEETPKLRGLRWVA